MLNSPQKTELSTGRPKQTSRQPARSSNVLTKSPADRFLSYGDSSWPHWGSIVPIRVESKDWGTAAAHNKRGITSTWSSVGGKDAVSRPLSLVPSRCAKSSNYSQAIRNHEGDDLISLATCMQWTRSMAKFDCESQAPRTCETSYRPNAHKWMEVCEIINSTQRQ